MRDKKEQYDREIEEERATKARLLEEREEKIKRELEEKRQLQIE